MNEVNFSDDDCQDSQGSQDGIFDALEKIDSLVGLPSSQESQEASLKKTFANVSLDGDSSKASRFLDSDDSDTNQGPIIHSDPESRPSSSSSSDSDTDSEVRIKRKSEDKAENEEESMDPRPIDSGSENEATKLDGDRPEDSANSDKSDNSDSDDEPVRIFRGSAPLPTQQSGSDDEMMETSSSAGAAPKSSKSKKPKRPVQQEEESFRDRQIRMREEHEDAKAEQARLLRETEIKLPRHQKVFSLDQMSPPKSSKPKKPIPAVSENQTSQISNADSENPNPTAESQKNPPPDQNPSISDKQARIAAKKARIAALAAAKAPTPGQGFLQLNPKMSDLQKKMVKHLTKKKSPKKMCTKVTEAVKNDIGEIVEIKEKIIRVEVKNEDEEIFHSLKNKKSKLTGLKQQLWENLRAERMRNFKEEQERLKAQEEMDEDNYLDKIDKELENEHPPGLVEN